MFPATGFLVRRSVGLSGFVASGGSGVVSLKYTIFISSDGCGLNSAVDRLEYCEKKEIMDGQSFDETAVEYRVG
jgi:hypothetical protein